MRRLAIIGGLMFMAACQKAPLAVENPCRAPLAVTTPSTSRYQVAKDASDFCIKTAAYQHVRAGEAVEAAARAALLQCAAHENQVIKAIAGPVMDYERKSVHEDMLHLAQTTAVQKRSMGCGAQGGKAENLGDRR